MDDIVVIKVNSSMSTCSICVALFAPDEDVTPLSWNVAICICFYSLKAEFWQIYEFSFSVANAKACW